jgi:hypothetical protein
MNGRYNSRDSGKLMIGFNRTERRDDRSRSRPQRDEPYGAGSGRYEGYDARNPERSRSLSDDEIRYYDRVIKEESKKLGQDGS